MEATKSEIPAAIFVCEANAADNAEMFLSNNAGSAGLYPSSFSCANSAESSQKHCESPARIVRAPRSNFSKSASVTDEARVLRIFLFFEIQVEKASGAIIRFIPYIKHFALQRHYPMQRPRLPGQTRGPIHASAHQFRYPGVDYQILPRCRSRIINREKILELTSRRHTRSCGRSRVRKTLMNEIH